MKRARLLQQQNSPPSSSSDTVSSAAPPPLPAGRFFVSTERRPARSAPAAKPGSPLDSIVASTSDPPARPIRYRMQK
ncbi:hypothetical protein HRG_007162 [Hirsutella rhossiliensis]|uniref:Uncharacterized protein n=1 Tax=Hirsutella rhossiliensis TaxID=111463 RepID=A0A9P8MZQ0_9HYPO|nr:uncharacterized protein HRG_07162 [Hirsutella rhossiliensis]KAH0962082.1 hypothetical protein HRG_07162 [Hirsutella rhossiliensis]